MTKAMAGADARTPIGGLPTTNVGLVPVPYEDLPTDLRDSLQARVERLGYLGAFFAFAAAQPDALLAFNAFTEALRRDVPVNLVELVALVVSDAYGNDYERVQHERLARHSGRSEDWIAATAAGADPAPFDSAERAVLEFVRAAVEDRGHGVSHHLESMIRHCGRPNAVGVLLLLARYTGHSHVANALELTAPAAVHNQPGGIGASGL